MSTLVRTIFILSLACAPLGAWSPKLHEVQTAKAVRLLPRRMAAFLRAHPDALLEGARGVANDQPPTVEEIEAQYRTVLRLSTERRRPEEIVRDLGVLAHQIQLLADPSATVGLSPLREAFEGYADEHQSHLVVTKEPYWATTGGLDPGPHLRRLLATKEARHRRLLDHYDEAQGRRLGTWDELSIPFAQLQLAFSNGIHATANVWMLLWREAGELWEIPAGP